MLGRLLQRFQKRIESALREHMHLVDDINAFLCFRGNEINAFADLANVVHAVVAGGVHFDYINNIAAFDTAAALASAAGVAVLRVFTVKRFRQNFGTGGFARSAGAAEQICMRRLLFLNFIPKHGCNMILPDDIRKGFRAPFAV